MSSASASPSRLDLRGTPCPLNYIRTRLALETLPPGASLEVWLDRGEPERMVSEGLRGAGHRLEHLPLDPDAVRLIVHTAAEPAGAPEVDPAGGRAPEDG